jgi:hypothetical protein
MVATRDAYQRAVQRFIDQVKLPPLDSTDECWLWTGCRLQNGYGQLTVNYRRISAHRFAWELAYGRPIPDGMWVLHHCDTPLCVRPSHLFLGTHADNTLDMVKKGRQATGDRVGLRAHPERAAYGDRNGSRLYPESRPRGAEHGRAKLTAEQVAEMRRLHASGALGYRKLARAFGISQRQAGRIVRGEQWAQESGQ